MMQPGWGLPPVPSSCQVRCAGCNGVLNVPAGVIEFRCPRCKLPQVLPPELLPPNLRPPVVQGIDPSKLQLPCRHCRSILNVPPGLSRFNCPQCKVEITVDQSKLLHPTFPLPSQPRKSRRLSPPPNNAKAHRNFSAPSSNNGKALADFWEPEPEPEPEPELMPESEPEEDSMDIESIDDKDETALETFTEYCPSKKGSGPPHPDPVVETSSLSAVQPPDVQYNLQIGQDIEKLKALSCLQFETVVLASQRHLQLLPDKTRAGFFLGDGAGVGKGRMIAALILENWQHGRRKAIWFSVSSDLQYDARRDLEDLGANFIKVHSLNKFPYTKLESKAAGVFDGVIFSTYSTLIASSESKKTRLEQLETWCGPDFDGMLVFDECHKAKNLIPDVGSQSSKTGEAVRDIQIKLPQARVVYCSATGASEPRNLAYMVRLGLWGEGTCFPRFENFSDALSRGGVGALELLAMEMKVRGMYVCRTLSYRSAEFEVVEVPLENSMNKIYTDATRLWAELRVEFEKAVKSWSEESQNNTLIWRLYWASQQRFFRHMCMAAKVPAVVRLAKKALQENKCVVIGLQTTGEARIEEAMTKCGGELEDFVSGPKELLLKLVEDQYPLPHQPSEMLEDGTNGRGQKRQQAHRVVAIKGRMRKAARLKAFNNGLESDGEETESEEDSAESDDDFTICDICYKDEPIDLLVECCCCRKFVHSCCMTSQEKELLDGKSYCSKCKEKNQAYKKAYHAYNAEMWTRYEEAKKRKDTILEAIRGMNLPNNPLDDIIDQIGGPQQVAEITGRRGRLVRDANGKIVHQARNTKDIPTEMVNMHEKQLFMEGKKLVAVISEAGSAGLSFQADKRALNQRRRVHITLELPWSADRAIQQLGRTHRANQVSAPQYRLLFTNLGGERRFASIVAKRLESLGALTQGDRRAGPSLSAYNFDSRLGKDTLNCMYTAILRQGDAPCLPPHYKNEGPEKIEHFYHQAKMALLTVGIIKDAKQGADQVVKTGGRILESDMKDIGRFLNRLLAIEPKIQNRIFEHFVDIFDILVMKARKEGEFDGGIVDVKANVIEVMDSKEVFKDSISHAATTLHRLKVERGMNWEDVHKLYEDSPKDSKDKSVNGFYESKREWYHRKFFLLALNCSKTSSTTYKIYRPANGENPREMHASELLDKYTMVISLEKARIEWEKEFQRSADQCMHGPNCKAGASCFVGRRVQEMYVLGGLIFPVWKKVEKALSALERKSQRHLRIVRIETTSDNKRIVGLHVPTLAVASVLEGLSSAA